MSGPCPACRYHYPDMNRRAALLALSLLLAALPAHAGPERYRLDAAQSRVAFAYIFSGAERTGQMPVAEANMLLDLDNLGASRVEVALDASNAQAGFAFATQAMRSPQVLDTANHPLIRFRSTSVTGNLARATVRGELTIRGVTRPVTLSAQLGRAPGTDPQQRDKLLVLLSGKVSRSAFGASGYPGYVADEIGIRITAFIEK